MDWAGLMRLGLAELRLGPAVFWALTPVELLVMAGREGRIAPMRRARFEELSARYPNETGDCDGR
jgi:uncharacterized phage protein (TIGR02216 family)